MINGQKYKELIDTLGVSVSKMEKTLGLSHARLSNAISRNSEIKLDIVEKTIQHFPQVSEQWLRTGDGEMLINSTEEYDVDYTPKKKQSSLSALHSKLLKLLLLDDDFDEELRREAREPLKKLDELIKKNEEMKKNG